MKINLKDSDYLDFKEILNIKLHKKFFVKINTDIKYELYIIMLNSLSLDFYNSLNSIQQSLNDYLNE